ncbi:Protein YdiH [Citrobacter freundii]
MLYVASDDRNFVKHIAFGHYLHREWCYTVQVLNTSEDDMSTQLDPAQLAIEFLRRDKTDLSPAQYLKRLKQLELEFADLLALSSTELKEEIYFAWRMGVH